MFYTRYNNRKGSRSAVPWWSFYFQKYAKVLIVFKTAPQKSISKCTVTGKSMLIWSLKLTEKSTHKKWRFMRPISVPEFPIYFASISDLSEIFRKLSIHPKVKGWSFPLALYFLIVKTTEIPHIWWNWHTKKVLFQSNEKLFTTFFPINWWKCSILGRSKDTK